MPSFFHHHVALSAGHGFILQAAVAHVHFAQRHIFGAFRGFGNLTCRRPLWLTSLLINALNSQIYKLQLASTSFSSILSSSGLCHPARFLAQTWGAATWPLHQCFFGAETAKPTRLASNLPSALHYGQCWHVLALHSSYLGPLMHCPHAHSKPSLGRENNEWRTSASAAYPPMFCNFLARMLLSALDEPRQVGQGMDSTSMHPAEALAEALLHPCRTRP